MWQSQVEIIPSRWESSLPLKLTLIRFVCFVLNPQHHSASRQSELGHQTLRPLVLSSIAIIANQQKPVGKIETRVGPVLGRPFVTYLGVCWAKRNSKKSLNGLKAWNISIFADIPVSCLGVGQGNGSVTCAFKALFRDSVTCYHRSSGGGKRTLEKLLKPRTKGKKTPKITSNIECLFLSYTNVRHGCGN